MKRTGGMKGYLSGQLHDAAALSPGKERPVHTEQQAGGTVGPVGTSWRK